MRNIFLAIVFLFFLLDAKAESLILRGSDLKGSQEENLNNQILETREDLSSSSVRGNKEMTKTQSFYGDLSSSSVRENTEIIKPQSLDGDSTNSSAGGNNGVTKTQSFYRASTSAFVNKNKNLSGDDFENLTVSSANMITNLNGGDSSAVDKLSDIELFWKASFQMKSFNDETTTNGVVSTNIYGELYWGLTENLSFQSQALFVGRNGFTQSIYDRKDRSRGLYMLESFFELKTNNPLFFRLGNIEQSFLQAPLLMTDRTFPSFILKYSLDKFSNFESHFLIQGSIPDNAEESVRRETQIIKGFPCFSVASFYIENSSLPIILKPYFFNRTTFFHYYNLSQAVAERSRIYQNTIDRNQSDSTFRYDYYGLHNHTRMRAFFNVFLAGELGFEYINNWGAGHYNNEGYRFYAGLYYDYNNLLELNSVFETFLNQSDSSVAYYNSEFYGHNGRKGFAVKLQAYLYDSSVSVGASFVNSRPINLDDKTVIGSSTAVSIFLTTNRIKISNQNRRI